MTYELTGKVDKFLEAKEGSSNKGPWKTQSIIVTTEDQYNNLYCFDIFGADKIETISQQCKVGDEIKVFFNVRTNEYQGRYFTSLSLWKIEQVNLAPAQNQSPADNSVPDTDNKDDLPF